MSSITRKRFEKEAEKVAEWVKETRPETVEEIERKAEEARREERKAKEKLKKEREWILSRMRKTIKNEANRLETAYTNLEGVALQAGVLDFDTESEQLNKITSDLRAYIHTLDSMRFA